MPVRFLNATFGKLLEFTKLTEDRAVQGRTLVSLQNIYPAQALLGGTDIHTLAKQMGNNDTAGQEALNAKHSQPPSPQLIKVALRA